MSFNLSKENLIETEKSKTFVVYWLKRIFIDDWVMKLVALLVTFALWLGVSGLQKTASRTLNDVSLDPILAEDMEITNKFVKEIDITLTGDENKVNNINPRNLNISFDVTDENPGERKLHLTPQGIDVELPSGVTVTKVLPEYVVFNIEKVIESDVPVIAETKGILAADFEVYNTSVIPEKVRVRGPKSFVEQLEFIPTEKIDLSGRRGDFVAQEVPINVGDVEKISLVDSVTVNVAFRIGKSRNERVFVVPYEKDKETVRVEVTLYGESTVLRTLEIEDIEIVTDTDNPDKLRVSLPEEIRNAIEVRKIEFQ